MMSNAKYWWAVMYPENMVSDWREKIGDIVQVPYCYCIHDKDLLKDEYDEDFQKKLENTKKQGKDVERKVHLHLILAFPNTTTQKHALETFKMLGEKSCNCCKKIIAIKQAYNYLIHDTESSRKQGKHLYDKDERISGNNFDIGAYEQLGLEEKEKMLCEIEDIIVDKNITNYMALFKEIAKMEDKEYRKLLRGNSGHFDRMIKANWRIKNGETTGKMLPDRESVNGGLGAEPPENPGPQNCLTTMYKV